MLARSNRGLVERLFSFEVRARAVEDLVRVAVAIVGAVVAVVVRVGHVLLLTMTEMTDAMQGIKERRQ